MASYAQINYRDNVVPASKSSAVNDLPKVFVQPYIGISADYIILTGGFDGKSYFQTTSERILVPKLTPSMGFGLQFGARIGTGAVDFAYYFARLPYTSMEDGFSGTSTNHFIRFLGFKKFLSYSAEKMIQPYIDVDLSASVSHFEKISYSFSNPSVFKSANYGGILIGIGAGTLFRLSEHMALDIKVLPELFIGTDVKPKNGTDYNIKKFNNLFIISSFGVNYYLIKK
jgi:hypothetical protein